MNELDPTIAGQLAQMASSLQQQRTEHAPRAATVGLGDTLVVTPHEAPTPAEKALAVQVFLLMPGIFLASGADQPLADNDRGGQRGEPC